MSLEEQYNKVKGEMFKLHKMLGDKAVEMQFNQAVPKHEVRRIFSQQTELERILANHFDFHDMKQDTQIQMACKIGDKY